MRTRLPIFKAFTKTILDSCVMPGTGSGAEIVWVYSTHMKAKVFIVTVALVSMAYSQMSFVFKKPIPVMTERENIR
ncbi:MAG TPA: hypothetical protein VD927_16860 [Chryseosolibacter sp.]|nr:hypothetical protein [Chryseosolibacter sp.]